jgi:hypothetical protein
MPSTAEKWKLCYKVWFEILEQFGVAGASLKEERDNGRLYGASIERDALAAQVAWAREWAGSLEKLKDLGDYLVAGLDEAEPKTFEFGLAPKYKAAYRAATQVKGELDEIARDWNDKLAEWDQRVEEGRPLTVKQTAGSVVTKLDGLFPKYEPDLGPLGQKISFKVKKKRKGEDD